MIKRISRNEIEELYKRYNTPEHVIAHCRAVTEAALRLAEHLNQNGYNLDLELIRGAGLAHDAARIYKDHGAAGAEALVEMGYYDEADIVRVHMYYSPFNSIDKLNECDMVCLGDRLVKEDTYVGLDERIEYIINKEPLSDEMIERIMERKAETAELLRQIGEVIGRPVDSLFEEKEKL